MRRLPADRVWTLVALGVALGYAEAVVGVYLGHLAGGPGMGAPLAPEALVQGPGWLPPTEQVRQVAVLIVLAAAAWGAGRQGREKIAGLLLAGGVCGLARLGGLKLMAGWPSRLTAPDPAFALLSPVLIPVWAVLLVAVAACAVGLALWPRVRRRRG